MLHGHLDTVTSSGYVEGWAFDEAVPLRPVAVSVDIDGTELAGGLANRYRWDLVTAGCGTGWTAFRLKLSRPAGALAGETVTLRAWPEDIALVQSSSVNQSDDDTYVITSLDDLIRSDPTQVHDIAQLHGCGRLFDDFIDAVGIDAFVRTAYLYVLGRPADPAGMASCLASLRRGSVKPYDLLKLLHDRDEFRAEPRRLAAPPEPGFPFRCP